VYLGVCDQVKAVEASSCATETYLDVLIGTHLEGQERLNSFDEVCVAFMHTVCVPWILHQEIYNVESESDIIRVAMLLTPGWGRSLRVMTNAWQVGLHMGQDWGGVVGFPRRREGKDVGQNLHDCIAEGVA